MNVLTRTRRIAYQLYELNKNTPNAESDWLQAKELIARTKPGQRCVATFARDGSPIIVEVSSGHSSY